MAEVKISRKNTSVPNNPDYKNVVEEMKRISRYYGRQE